MSMSMTVMMMMPTLSCMVFVHSVPFYATAGEIGHDIIYLGHFLEEENWDGQLLLNAMVIIVPFMCFLLVATRVVLL